MDMEGGSEDATGFGRRGTQMRYKIGVDYLE
jgi:hypothetical protein